METQHHTNPNHEAAARVDRDREVDFDGLGPLARAWLSLAGGARAVTRAQRRKRETPFDSAALLELRPPAPVKRSTDTIVGWRLDPDWIG